MTSKTQIQRLMSDVQDPSDFPQQSEAPGLRLLDSALRCTICSELFDGPVTLKCGHCFCSLCIRQALAEKQECPACRESDVNEGHLRKNPAMEEAVAAWKECRPYILRILDENSRRVQVESSRPSKRRRLHDESGPTSEIICVESTASQDSSTPTHSEQAESDTPNSDKKDTQSARPDDLIDCPLCNKRVKFKDINRHLDEQCRDEPEPVRSSSKSQWDSILGSKSKVQSSKKRQKERVLPEDMDDSLPTKSYDTLRDKAIRDLLHEHDLLTTGDRKTIVARHQRWVIIYNANLDKTHKMRKSLTSLRRDLRDWETQQKNKTKHDLPDPTAYQIQQKSEFDMLVEAARPKETSSAIRQTLSRHGQTEVSDSSRSRTKTLSPAETVIIVDCEGEN
ncbi:hypothetical protein F5051DRAFT_504103 [Lentinula edodes]|nr:hypothetical protein F5051DRAFT_504103 [Lentinula edodes]